MANKNFDFFVRYIDPEEAARTTPAKRRERVAGPYSATSVGRALTKFFNEVNDGNMPGSTRHWPKKEIVVVDVMRGKGAAGPQMADDEEEAG